LWLTVAGLAGEKSREQAEDFHRGGSRGMRESEMAGSRIKEKESL